jgi:hypothetical protein
MWEVSNRTPFAAGSSWVRDREGAEVWLVAVRGTFAINPDGSTVPAEQQEESCLVPTYRGEPGKSSLIYDTDLLHTKPTTDILLHGHAYSPEGKPTVKVDVTMKVGPIAKTLRVVGDRVWRTGVLSPATSDPEPFEKMPITYERAYGGADLKSDDPRKHDWDRRNPVGTGFAVVPEHLIGEKVPNIEDPRDSIRSWIGRPSPAGFGPIPPDWMPRVKWAGTYDEKWEKDRLPLLPEDFDDRFYLCAPQDQQAPHFLRGGEDVELVNLTPDGSLRFRLPRVALGFSTRFSNGEKVVHRGMLHTVIIEPDVPRVLLVWHTQLPCHPKVLKLEETTISLKRILRPPPDGRVLVQGPDEEVV